MDGFAESVVHPPTQTNVFNRDILFLLVEWWFSYGFMLNIILSLGYFPDSYNASFNVKYFEVPVNNTYVNLQTHFKNVWLH